MKRVLVAFASKRGSTAEIAQAIADTLQEQGLSVDCREAGDIRSLQGYDAVVLGSAVYIKRWRHDGKDFLGRHASELARLPFWVFSSGPVGDPDAPSDPAWLEPPRIIERASALGARDHVVFGGRLPLHPRGPIERAMAKGIPEQFHDRRDWNEIRAWSIDLAAEIQAATAAARG